MLDTSNYKLATENSLKRIAKSKIIAIDFETNGVNAYDSKIKLLSVSFSIKEGESRIVLLDKAGMKLISLVKRIFESNATKIVAARPFEENFALQKLHILLHPPVYDVLVMAHLYNETNIRVYNLENVTNKYTSLNDIKDIAEHQRATLETSTDDLKIAYNGVDTDATLRCFNVLSKRLAAKHSLSNYFFNLLQPAQDMYAALDKYGMKMNTEDIRKNEADLCNFCAKLSDKTLNLLPDNLKEKYKKKLKLTIPSLIKDYLFLSPEGLKLTPIELTEKNQSPATSKKALIPFKNKKFVSQLLTWKMANKILTTYFKQLYSAMDNKETIHPSTLFTRTVTGRQVVLNPTLQTIPQRNEYAHLIKELFKAPEGYYLFGRDLGQSEFRIAGWLADEKNVLQALKEGVDVHKKTASLMSGKPIEEVTKEERQFAKPINFGLIYGAGWRTLQTVAFDDYGVKMTDNQAKNARNKFFSMYPAFEKWHIKIITYARKHHKVVSPLGRERHLEDINSRDDSLRMRAERQAVNFSCQSFSSDLNLISQFLFYKYIKKYYDFNYARPLFLIHDASYGFCKKEVIKEVQRFTKMATEVWSKKYIKNKFDIDVSYPVGSVFEYGDNWENLKEVEDDSQ